MAYTAALDQEVVQHLRQVTLVVVPARSPALGVDRRPLLGGPVQDQIGVFAEVLAVREFCVKRFRLHGRGPPNDVDCIVSRGALAHKRRVHAHAEPVTI
jgi:hypothetical protein